MLRHWYFSAVGVPPIAIIFFLLLSDSKAKRFRFLWSPNGYVQNKPGETITSKPSAPNPKFSSRFPNCDNNFRSHADDSPSCSSTPTLFPLISQPLRNAVCIVSIYTYVGEVIQRLMNQRLFARRSQLFYTKSKPPYEGLFLIRRGGDAETNDFRSQNSPNDDGDSFKVQDRTGSNPNEIFSSISSTETHWTGVVDLRPKPSPDSIILFQFHKSNVTSEGNRLLSTISEKATFSQDTNFHLSPPDYVAPLHSLLEQNAITSQCIGSLCSTLYLIVAYDFENGKTILHRTFGGVKLMNLVDGIRIFWNNNQSGRNVEQRGTKLVLILVRSSLSDIDQNTPTSIIKNASTHSSPVDWGLTSLQNFRSSVDYNMTGAAFLVNKMKSYFGLGGGKYQDVDPFSSVEILLPQGHKQRNQTNEADRLCSNLIEKFVSEHISNNSKIATPSRCEINAEQRLSTREYFQISVQSTYEILGGSQEITFTKSNKRQTIQRPYTGKVDQCEIHDSH